MTPQLLGEFLGTMMLVLLGDGVVAAVLLKRSKAEGSGWIVITAGWAFAVMAGVFTAIACGSSDAHLLSEVIATFVLVFVVGAIFSTRVTAAGPAAGLAPYLVGGLVWGIGLSLGGPTGYAINPARDLGPRIAHAILPIAGKGGSDWTYAPVPVVGPLAGGILAGALLRVLGI
jgi:glycerol uptake facilitator protein